MLEVLVIKIDVVLVLVIKIDVVGLLDFCKFRIGDALERFPILNKVLIVQSEQREKS